MIVNDFRSRRAELEQSLADRGENYNIDSAEVTSATYGLLRWSAGVPDCHPGAVPRTMLIDGVLVAEKNDGPLSFGRCIFWTDNNSRYVTDYDSVTTGII